MAIRTTGVRYDLIARDSASKTFATVGGSASKLEKGLGKLGAAAIRTGAALAGGIAVGLAVSAKRAVDFEASMKKIQTQAGATQKDVGLLSKQVLELGKTTQQGPEKLSEALYHLKSVGMDNVQAMKALKTASDLAAVGGADLEDTANALAGAWRTGIKGATSFGQAASTVNAIIGAGNMSMGDLTAALGTGILPTAKTFGLTFGQVGAALALFTDEGVDSASAATRLRMSISLLAAATPAAEKQLKKIHLTSNQLGEAMRGPQGIIGAITLLKTHLDGSGLSATKQAALLSRAFGGGKSSSAILSMVNNLDVLEAKQAQVNASMGKYGAAVTAQRKTAAAQLHLIESNIEVFSIKAGNALLPPITRFTTYINRTALPAASRYSRSLLGLVPVARIRAGFTTARGMLGDFVTGIMPEGKKPAALTIPVPQIKAPTVPALLRRPYTFTTPAPQIKASGIPKMLRVPKAQDSEAKKFGAQLRAVFSGGLGDAVKGLDWGKLGRQIGGGLSTAIGWVGQHAADLSKKVITALGKLDYVGIGKSFGAMAIPLSIGFINNLFAPLFSGAFWKAHWLDTIMAVLSVIPIGRVGGVLGKVLTKVPVLKIFAPFFDRLGGLGRLVEKPVGKALSGAWKVAEGIGRGFVTGMEKIFPGMSAAITGGFRDLGYRIFSAAVDLGAAATRTSRAIGAGIIRGAEGLGSIMGRVAGYIVKPFATAGTWLLDRGSAVVTGLRTGISTGAARLGTWATDHMVTPVTSRFSAAGSWLVSRGSAMVSGMKSGISAGAARVGSWTKANVVDKIVGAFTKSGSWLYSHGRSLVTGLISGTWDALKGVGSWASGVKDRIVGAIKSVFKIHSPSRVMAELGGHMMTGLLHGLLSGKDILNSTVKGLFSSPLDAAATLLKNGVSLPAEWMSKLLGAKAPRSADVPLNPGVASAQQYASGLVAQMWPKDAASQMGALRSLWMSESGWRANARNPSSGAYGIPQALPPQKMASAGSDWRTSAATQIRWGLGYIKSRYGDPATAWGSWNVHRPHWYAKGTPGGGAARGWAWVGERGPELVRFGGGETVLNHLDSLVAARSAGIQIPGYASGTGSLGTAQRKVAAAQSQVDYWRRREAADHTKRQKHIDSVNLVAAQRHLSAAKAELAAAKKHQTSVTSVANTIANGFLRTLETGTAAAIAAAVKSMNSKLQAAGAGNLVAGNLRTSSQLQALAAKKAGIASRIASAQQYATDQSSSLGDFLSLSNTPSASISSLISRMADRQKQGGAFAAEVSSLSKRGLDKSLLSQLADAGPGSQLAALLGTATASDIGQLNKLAASQKKLTMNFGQTMADAMYDSGAQAGKGFLSGLKAQEAALQAEMDKLAAGMVKTIKTALGIHSPSRVMRDQVGKPTALGAAVGVRQYAPHAVREAQRMADTMAAVRARSGAAGGTSAAGGGVQVVHHHTHTTYEISARTVDMDPQALEVVQRRAEARQRVGRPR
jgi:TP901 family phage tail tape measure protein